MRGKPFGYDPVNVAYSRDEERTTVQCEMNGYKVDVRKTVPASAKGHAKNKVGTIDGDASELSISKDGKSFALRLVCAVK